MSPYLGLIEGFYGLQYSNEQRVQMMSFLQSHGYNFYIYAPKGDLSLRNRWMSKTFEDSYNRFAYIAKKAKERNIDFGISLSPLNITGMYDKEHKDMLLYKVKKLTHVENVTIFTLLFDDVKLVCDEAGKIQNEIIKDVANILPDNIKRFIVCPSYYTLDPILDKFFGQRPITYYKDFTDSLDKEIEIFWTGNKVLSEDITVHDISIANALYDRKVFIWDNYPVNDGKKISRYIFIKPFAGRRDLVSCTTGHAINPMLEPLLSTLSMTTLPLIYDNKDVNEIKNAYIQRAYELFADVADEIMPYLDLLHEKGLDEIEMWQKEKIYSICNSHNLPALNEIRDFLNEVYKFDESCLTDN